MFFDHRGKCKVWWIRNKYTMYVMSVQHKLNTGQLTLRSMFLDTILMTVCPSVPAFVE
jgi:hypothetical protein